MNTKATIKAYGKDERYPYRLQQAFNACANCLYQRDDDGGWTIKQIQDAVINAYEVYRTPEENGDIAADNLIMQRVQRDAYNDRLAMIQTMQPIMTV